MSEERLYAEVVVNRPISPGEQLGGKGGFTYLVPPSLRPQVRLGQLVRVPFGDVRQVGVVVGFGPPPEGMDVRPVEAILDPEPVLLPHQLALARFLARTQLAPLARCVALMLPPGLFPPPEVLLEALPASPEDLAALSGEDRRILDLVRAGSPLSLRALRRRARQPWPSAYRRLLRLIRLGLVARRSGDARPRLRPRRAETVRLAVAWEAVPEALATLGRESELARLLLSLLRSRDPLPEAEALCRATGSRMASLRALERKGWVRVLPARAWVEWLPPLDDAARLAEEVRGRAPAQAQAIALLAEAGGRSPQEDLEASGASREALAALERRGWVRRWEESAQAMLLLGEEEALSALAELRGVARALEVLRFLRQEGRPVWIGGVYAQTAASRATLQALEEAGLIALEDREVPRDPLAGLSFPAEKPPALTPDQEAVWQELERGIALWLAPGRPPREERPPVFLLHGVTGSGKTELYLRALERTLALGRQAVVLVPEIALTPQTIRRFAMRFPGRVTTLHSGLSPGERYDQWRRVRAGQVDVVIGPRSALFAPLPRLGLIVLDEEHETSYKESRPPCYHAREAALELARLTGSVVLLGSATPSLESAHRAQEGAFRLLSLPQRIFRPASPEGVGEVQAVPGPLPPVHIVDMREELRAGNRSIFSRRLRQALDEALSRGEQAILFLNRRGSATFVLCRDCGHVLQCPRCELPLTYHRAGEALRCHHCGFQMAPPGRCPACGSARIRYFGTGTQRVEEAVKVHWPQARVLRWDLDTARTRGAHERTLHQFATRQADVLVGTQMVAKGLDLPWVTLVGVVAADTALNLPDFRAAERTFQLLTQVAGRAGRSPRGGQVVVQTYLPEHYAIQAASRHDFAAFYREEMAFRRRMGYPPFGRLARLLFVHSRWSVCQRETGRVAEWLEGRLAELGLPGSALLGPVPCFFVRERGRFRWHLVVRAADPVRVLEGVPLGPGWRVDVDPVDLL
ncbi:MAG: replication restart helicase PriA [Anaerolineae bacterium]